MARYLRRLSLIADSFWIGCALQREYTMGQPLQCLLQNDLQKCPVENCLLPNDRRDTQPLPRPQRGECLCGYRRNSGGAATCFSVSPACVGVSLLTARYPSETIPTSRLSRVRIGSRRIWEPPL